MEIKKTGIVLEYLGHSGFLVNGKGKRIAVDPYNVSDGLEKVDIVLITHCHKDSCSIVDIEKLSRQGTAVFCPADCQSKLMKVDGIDMNVVEVGDKLDLQGVRIETVAAYNKYKDYHPKSEGWLGYIIKIGDVVVYHSGDSDFIPEMQKLSGYGKRDNNFIVLLPVSGKEVMDAEQASEVASLISPDLAIPMGFGGDKKSSGTSEDAEQFIDLCKEKNIEARILEKI